MPTELAYHIDPFCWEFDAEIIETKNLPDGRVGVILPKTYFYPTGGGQEHDTGTLGAANVTDVLIDDAGVVTHIVDRPVTGRVRAKIDGARRFAFMQHHSGQHLLSQAILEAQHIDSISANINIANPSTIDLDTNRDLDLTPGENLANAIIFQDRPIKAYSVAETQIDRVPLRRPPKVSGTIRIIEIDKFDYCACGGTHVTSTGMIGIVKIVKTEHVNKKLRVHFICGDRALRYFQTTHNLVTQVARQLDTSVENVTSALEKQNEIVREMQRELKELREIKLGLEVEEIAARAEMLGKNKLAVASFQNRAAQELRTLGLQLQNEPGLIAVLGSYDGTKVSIVVACAPDTGVSANELIRPLLADIGGRGGGDARLAQGGGAANPTWVENLREKVKHLVVT